MSTKTDGTMVWLGSMSEETRYALRDYSSRWDYNEWLEDRSWVSTEHFAWLIALLKEETDTPEVFPKGKWATLQRMEHLLSEAMKEYIQLRLATQPTPLDGGTAQEERK